MSTEMEVDSATGLDPARAQVQKIFEYLIEYSRLKSPPKLQVSEYDWHLSLTSLPRHPSVEMFVEPTEVEGERLLLRVGRPELKECPRPPEALSPWLQAGWERFETKEVQLVELSVTGDEDDDEDATREGGEEESPPPAEAEYPSEILDHFEAWNRLRQIWRVEEAPARKAYQLFDRFFTLKGTLEREGEKYALTLGDGILHWNTQDGRKVDHPLLAQRCAMAFDPEIPQFTLTFSDDSLQFPTGLLREVEGADLGGLPSMLDDLRNHPFDLLSEEAADFLRGLVRRLWSQGEFYLDQVEKLPEGIPSLRRAPVLMLTPRDRGYADAAEYLLSVLDEFEVPSALLSLIGVDVETSDEVRQRAAELPLLFTKPSNPEQERVARRLESNGCVLVQGPPGTGKTHTIANLIGHLLAQGKSILVTSHTSKALSVVRDQVVEQLRSLCVSVLDDGSEGQKHLEAAVKAIADKLTETTADELDRQAAELKQSRQRLQRQLEETEGKLLEAHRSEYDDLLVGGHTISPVEAARRLREGKGQHDWIPGQLSHGCACPLTQEEVEELYQLQALLPPEDEQLLATGLPPSDELIDPARLEELAATEVSLRESGTDFGSDLWTRRCQDLQKLEELQAQAQAALSLLETDEPWLVECLAAGGQAGEARLWRELLAVVQETADQCAQRRSLVYEQNPQIKDLGWPLHRQIEICKELLEHTRGGGKFGFFNTFLKSEWKRFLAQAMVQNAPPSQTIHFEALLAVLELKAARERLCSRWDLQMKGLKAPALPDEAPEREAVQVGERMRVHLEWEEKVWKPFLGQVTEVGVDWNKLYSMTSVRTGYSGSLKSRQEAISIYLARVLHEQANAVRLQQLEASLAATYKTLSNCNGPLSSQLLAQVRSRNLEAYRSAWERLRALESQVHRAQRRPALLERLREAARTWSKAIEERTDIHGQPVPPGPLSEAWCYAQWSQQLNQRHQLDLDQLQRRASDLKEQLRKLTANYVEVLTWKFQARRAGNAQRQALNGWLESMRRIGKGTGKYAEVYKAKAREKLKECRSAVPVWIMPFSRVVESYRPGETLFDVVIVDEASQADVTGLLAFALGREVIVVGDDQQVSPTAFEQVDKAIALAQERLQGIPNWELYSGKRSVYDMAKTSFGETIRLKEHFRCVPDIIAFSNQLCYDGEIKPLRESHKSLVPAVVSHRVVGGQRQGKAKTNDGEAWEITALIAACIEQPEYLGKTFGVISMVGDDQALLIQRYLTNQLQPTVLQSRRILCGNAAQFQGDERDVMLLSLVNSPNPTGGPLRLIESRMEDVQRYNVAASRAKDQMWLVHSLQPASDLKPNDLRARLLKHAEGPAAEATLEALRPSTESIFEAQVLERLVRAGYRVVPQLPIGSYRVDMVVLGQSRRIAIECDGEAYHGPDRVEQDLARQQLLERVAKLTFIRIRGSHYFRDPDEAMRLVFQRLEELGVEKLGGDCQDDQPVDHPLRDRVVGRAQALLRQWRGETTMDVLDSVWQPLLSLLEEWPVLQLSAYDTGWDVRAFAVCHDGEEIVVVDRSSADLKKLTESVERKFLEWVEVDPAHPQEALMHILEALGLDDRVDSQEMMPPAKDSAATEPRPPAPEEPEVETLSPPQAIVSMLMQVVKADGVVLEEELRSVGDFFANRFRYGKETVQDVQEWIQLYAQREAPRAAVSAALRQLTREQRELVLQGAVELAWCDNDFHPAEQSVIRSLGVELDLDRATVEGLLAQSSQDDFDPYKVLGVTPYAEAAEIVAAVQQLRKRFEPAQFEMLGGEFQELAATRRAEVEKAWSLLGSKCDVQATPVEPEPRPAPPPAPTPTPPRVAPQESAQETSVEDYVTFDDQAGPDPRTSSVLDVMHGLLAILKVEAPVTTSRLFETYLRGCGIKRLGGELRKQLARSLHWALVRDLARLVEGDDAESLHAVVALPQGPNVRIRSRGPRQLEQIPDTELRALGQRLAEIYPAESEDHLRAVLEHYELKRLTTQTRERLLDALSGNPRCDAEETTEEE